MSRFRVWCKNKNEWETDEVFLRPGGTLVHLARMGGFVELRPETHIVQFSTNLKDKNGKLIFENDILRQHKDSGTTLLVKWEKDGHWYVEDKDLFVVDYLWRWAKVTEIIGNIYENPELLK